MNAPLPSASVVRALMPRAGVKFVCMEVNGCDIAWFVPEVFSDPEVTDEVIDGWTRGAWGDRIARNGVPGPDFAARWVLR